MLLIIRFFFLVIGLVFYSSSIASPQCWAHLKPSDTVPRYFILAMGANTGNLKMANSDAQAFAKAIRKRFNVPPSHVCVLTDVVFRDFMNALKQLQKFVQRQDKVFIYFSGHGTTRKEEDNYDEVDCLDEVFVTYPSESRITDDKFVKWVNKINTSNIITFIDTCFASGMLRGGKGCPKKAKSKFWSKSKVNDKIPSRSCRLKNQLKHLKGVLYAASQCH